MIPAQPSCPTCETCPAPKECSFILLGSTTCEPLAQAVADALTADSDFPCNGAYRGLGTGSGYATSFAGLECGLASRGPKASELSTISADKANTLRMFAFGKTGTCIVAAAAHNTAPTTWTKAAFCAALTTLERSVHFVGHPAATATHVQRLATACAVSNSAIKFDTVLDTTTVVETVVDLADSWLGVVPPDELQPYLNEGKVSLVSVDGKTCLDPDYFASSNLYFVVNNIGTELTTQFLDIARATLRELDGTDFGLAIDPEAVAILPSAAV
jgi:hypothetical protein